MRLLPVALVSSALLSPVLGLSGSTAATEPRRWLAGDAHVHSQWSPGYDRATSPPTYLRGADAMYSTPKNASMAHAHGLSWMVTTDHGGPTHARLNRDEAYPELLQSRKAVPDLLQFYGMELNMPAMDHHTLIVPRAADEREVLYEIESRFDAADAWPADPSRGTAAARHAALAFLASLPRLPLVFANHPSRSATGLRQYGLDEPAELRDNNTRAPQIYRGLEGAPGHQASGLARDGSPRRDAAGALTGYRGGYSRAGAHTLGGFDQMTAIVGGVWDAMLAEGRRFWVVAASDSHVHFDETTRQGNDFWPGEFHKTYVLARKDYADVLDGLREGRVFAVAGDLISELSVTARAGRSMAAIGGTVRAAPGQAVELTIAFRDPAGPNFGGRTPSVARIDVIVGDQTGPAADLATDTAPATRVVARLTPKDWKCRGETCSLATRLPASPYSQYVRVRGTSTTDDEPAMDTAGENPWDDLWFYANPVFIDRGVIAPRLASPSADRVGRGRAPSMSHPEWAAHATPHTHP